MVSTKDRALVFGPIAIAVLLVPAIFVVLERVQAKRAGHFVTPQGITYFEAWELHIESNPIVEKIADLSKEHGRTGAFIRTELAVLVYFAPALVAYWRRHHRLSQIALNNLLLGWTVVVWVLALVTALSRATPGPETKACPFCAEEVLAAAIKCKHCGEMLGE